jgi:hypothetical protein
VLAAGRATARPGRPEFAEYYRFAEDNPAVSRVIFRKMVNFRVLAELAGLVM